MNMYEWSNKRFTDYQQKFDWQPLLPLIIGGVLFIIVNEVKERYG